MHPAATPPGQIVAAIVGNTLEVFDFIAYGTFAVMIGRAFFPAHDPELLLLLSVSTFGVGFVTRPLGALLIGALADRRGNRAGMLASLALMGTGSLIIGLLPGYATLGRAAPILLVVARLIQGIAWGGEAGPATIFLLDAAGPATPGQRGRQGRLVAWQGVSQAGAVLLCGLLGVLLDLSLGHAALSEWGWRVPFLLGTAVVPVGLWLRAGLHAPPGAAPEAGIPPHPPLRRVLACGFLMMTGGTITQYFLNFSTSYALTTLHLPIRNALSVAMAIGVCGAAAAWCGGWLSDRYGSRLVAIWPRLALAVLVLPGLWLVSGGGGTVLFIALCAVIAMLQACGFVASIVLMLRHLPPALRATRFGMVYALAIAAFGGTAQIAFVWLIHATGSAIAPGWYLLLVNLLCAGAAMALPDDAGRDRRMLLR